MTNCSLQGLDGTVVDAVIEESPRHRLPALGLALSSANGRGSPMLFRRTMMLPGYATALQQANENSHARISSFYRSRLSTEYSSLLCDFTLKFEKMG